MTIPWTKAHGARNDFLLTWAADAPLDTLGDAAIPICDRHAGVGADGWIVVAPGSGDCEASIRLFNSDGSEPEISGNGTRCAAAFLIDAGLGNQTIRLMTGAGEKDLRLLERDGNRYRFEMNMGPSETPDANYRTEVAGLDAAILNVGNPQCAVFVDSLPRDWRDIGARIERLPEFPNRTNVSFIRVVDEHTLDVTFWERGAGETMSSGTGSTGAALAAIGRGVARSPVRILTPAGPMELRVEDGAAWLTGPAEIVAKGEFYL